MLESREAAVIVDFKRQEWTLLVKCCRIFNLIVWSTIEIVNKIFIHHLLHFLIGRNLKNAHCLLWPVIGYVLSIVLCTVGNRLWHLIFLVDWSQTTFATIGVIATTLLLIKCLQLLFKKLLIKMKLLMSLIVLCIKLELLRIAGRIVIDTQIFKRCLHHLSRLVVYSWWKLIWLGLYLRRRLLSIVKVP